MAKMAGTLSLVGNGIHVNYGKPPIVTNRATVFRGEVESGLPGRREVAVRREVYNDGHKKKLENELEAMIKLGSHENTVRYFKSYFTDKREIFIAMELCQNITLEDIVKAQNESGEKGNLSLEDERAILVHIARGLQHIHNTDIKNVMLNPKKILLSEDGKSIKIIGLATSKPVNGTDHFSHTDMKGEWGSPEYYSKKEKTQKSDIFSAGLLFHYVLSDGKHPFGNEGNRRIKIQQGNHSINIGEHPYKRLAEDLIERMLSFKPEKRPSASEILSHPFLLMDQEKAKCADILLEYWEKVPNDERPTPMEHSGFASGINSHDRQQRRDAVLLLVSDCNMQLYFDLLKKSARKAGRNIDQKLQKCGRPAVFVSLELAYIPEEREVEYNHSNIQTNSTSAEPEFSSPEGDNDDFVYVPGLLKIFRRPKRNGSAVYDADILSGFPQRVVIKLVDIRLVQDCGWDRVLKSFHDIDGAAQMQSSEIFQRPNLTEVSHFEGKCFCLLMQPIHTESVIEVAQTENFSPENRKIAALQIVYILSDFHAHNIVHGNISPNKFCLSIYGQKVMLLPSRNMKWHEMAPAQNAQIDLLPAAKVLAILLYCKADTSIQEVWEKLENIQDLKRFCNGPNKEMDCLFHDLLYQLSSSSTYSLLCHPYFFPTERKESFLREVSKLEKKMTPQEGEVFNKNLEQPIVSDDWIDRLKLMDDEKELWYPGDSDGAFYYKANKSASRYKEKRKLVTLMRNHLEHYEEIIEEEYYKKKQKEENWPISPRLKQTLIRNPGDVWMFYSRRFPNLFLAIYKFVKDAGIRPEKFKLTKPAFKQELPKMKRNAPEKSMPASM